MYIWPEIGARIVAVPSIGHDSRRAACGFARRSKSLGIRSKWLLTCGTTVDLSSMAKEFGLVRCYHT